jgi:hypothetical protein
MPPTPAGGTGALSSLGLRDYLVGGATLLALAVGVGGWYDFSNTRKVDAGSVQIMGEAVQYEQWKSGLLGRDLVYLCLDRDKECVKPSVFEEEKWKSELEQALQSIK